MPIRITPEGAEILGLQALGWLAGDADDMELFFRASGMDVGDLRRSASDPHLLGAVLEYLLANEELLLRFCEESAVRPADIHAARHRLEG